jgi:hypothetical protein
MWLPALDSAMSTSSNARLKDVQMTIFECMGRGFVAGCPIDPPSIAVATITPHDDSWQRGYEHIQIDLDKNGRNADIDVYSSAIFAKGSCPLSNSL